MGGLIDAEPFYADVPLRSATLADVPLLVRHRRLMWADIGGFSPADLDAADVVYSRWLRREMRAGRIAAWVSEVRGAAAASGVLWLQLVQPRPLHPTGATPYLMSMYTERAHRGAGHAKRIVKAAIAWTKRNGYPHMTLHASDMGRPIYEKLGFVRTWEMKLDLTPRRAPRRAPRAAPRRSLGRSRSA